LRELLCSNPLESELALLASNSEFHPGNIRASAFSALRSLGMKTLAEKVRSLLRKRGWTQAELAAASGLGASVLSRLLSGERPWRREHITCLAAAFSLTPHDLVSATDHEGKEEGGEVDAEFVGTLMKAHAALVAENARLASVHESLKKQGEASNEKLRSYSQELDELHLALERERRSRATSDTARVAAEEREGRARRESLELRAERAALASNLEATRAALLEAQTKLATAVEAANRNYATAKDLERRLSSAQGVAAVTGLFGLTLLAGALRSNDDT